MSGPLWDVEPLDPTPRRAELYELDVLVRSARRGHRGARDELVRRFQGLARSSALPLVARDEVDDVVQEALVEAISSLDELREPFAFPLLVRLAVRKHADRRRRSRRSTAVLPVSDLWDADPDLDPALLAERGWVAGVVQAALAAAPDPDRRLLELRYLAEWTTAQLADASGLSDAAIRKRLHDARRRLRPSLWPLAPQPRERKAPMTDATTALGNLYREDGVALDPEFTPIPGSEVLTLIEPSPLTATAEAVRLTTGLRVVDIVAPLVRGGLHDLVGPFGSGHLVLVIELLTRLERDAPTVCVAVGCRAWHNGGFSNLHKFLLPQHPNPNRFTVITAESVDEAQAAVALAGRLARALATESNVLFVVDDGIATTPAGAEILSSGHGLSASGHHVTALHVDPYEIGREPEPPRPGYDGRLQLSLDLVARGLFPAIEPRSSNSKLVGGTDAEGNRARRIRSSLELAERISKEFSQGLLVAETKTGQPGEWVQPEDAAAALDDLLTGIGTARAN